MRIGSVQLVSNLLLAPIAGYFDLAFRLAIRPLGGLGLVCTELANPRGVLRHTRASVAIVDVSDEQRPVCVQLYGCDAAEMIEAGRLVVDQGASIIDINMGCPVDKVTKRHGGSAWLCDPEGALRLVERVLAGVPVPVTVKVRLGPNERQIVAPFLARRFADLGVAAMTVHGRTTEQKFSGRANWQRIGEVVAAAGSMPVIGNGDVDSPSAAARLLEVSGCAGVMIGRAALKNPWIFRDTHAYLTTGRIPPPPTRAQRVAMMVEHFDHLVRLRGEEHACILFRQRVSAYAKQIAPCKQFHEQVRFLQSAADFHRFVEELLSEWAQASERMIRPASLL